MKRYNIFNQIHKALRALLYDSSLQLQQTDFADPAQVRAVTGRVQLVLEMFEGHAHTENNFILPKLSAYEPSVCDAFEKEHEEDMQLGEIVAVLLRAVNEATTVEVSKEMGQQLVIAFIDFMVFNLDHMKEEEDVLNNLLWRYYSDEELVGLTRSIVGSIPSEKMAITSRWMIKGLANDEIVHWLKEIRDSAPPFILESLTRLAKEELSEQRWNWIEQQVFSNSMVA
jgi:hypothetical protein